MTNGNDEAFGHGSSNGHCPGLTKREYFAAMAMQGMIAGISNRDELGIIANSPADIAEIAMVYARCLIDELNATEAE